MPVFDPADRTWVPSKEYIQEHEARLRLERKQFWTRIRAAMVVTLLALLVASAFGYSYTMTVAHQVQDLRAIAFRSCGSRNAALEEQRRVYTEFIATERSDSQQAPELQRAKILTYQNALDRLPDPVDCSVYR